MNKKLKKALKIALILGVLALLVTIIPLWILALPVLAYLACGVVDVTGQTSQVVTMRQGRQRARWGGRCKV